MKRIAFLGAVSMLAVAAGAPALAQEAGEGETGQTEQTTPADDAVSRQQTVVVSGSRVIANGFQAPTPVTVTTTEQLKAVSPDLSTALRQLPQLSGTASPAGINPTTGSGPTTNSSANLRNLGPERTLILLDGRRAPPSLLSGTTDASYFPLGLVERVEIVTGGASAAYGSGAVAGVVNYILDTDFEGLKAEVRGGIAGEGDGGLYGIELVGGRSFDDGRGNLVVSLDVRAQDGINGDARAWSRKGVNTILTPNRQPGDPSHLLGDNANSSIATFNGLITTPGPLFRTAFDPAGNPIPYTPGFPISGAGQFGGDGASYPAANLADSRFASLFAMATYDLTDSSEIYVQGSYGMSDVAYPLLNPFSIGGRAYTIRQDNAFLPDSIRDTMVANGIQSFALSKIESDIGQSVTRNKSNTLDVTVGFNADLPFGLALESYYEHGETLFRYGAYNNLKFAESKLAADAVINPANGQIVCRSTLTNPGNGCVPIDVFGFNPLSETQKDYLIGQSLARSVAKQDVVAATLSGELFSTWAGGVPMAAGVEYRKLSNTVETDEVSQRVGWSAANYFPSEGSYDVYEAFAEALVPLARDLPLAKNLDLNAAIRYTDYSTSGGITSWKLGMTNEVVDGLRLRATLSRDIRAPHIGELFGGLSRGIATLNDPANGNQVIQNVFVFSGSNEDLQPEMSETFTAGVVYEPSFIDGLGLSVDYYSLEIEDAIAQLTAQSIVDQCAGGNASLCALITRDAGNQLSEIRANLQNVQTAEISGVDFEANYRVSLLGGDVAIRGIATYLETFVFNSPGATSFEQAGYTVRPHWMGNIFASYSRGPWSVTVSERLMGESYRLAAPNLVNDPKTSPAAYTNLNVLYRFEDDSDMEKELFFNVSNLFDKEPQAVGMNSVALSYNLSFAPGYYDTVGRYFTVGARIKY